MLSNFKLSICGVLEFWIGYCWWSSWRFLLWWQL